MDSTFGWKYDDREPPRDVRRNDKEVRNPGRRGKLVFLILFALLRVLCGLFSAIFAVKGSVADSTTTRLKLFSP